MHWTRLGKHFFKIALLLRDSLLLSSVIYNIEIWYNVSDKDILELSPLDSILFSKLFRVPQKIGKEAYYLETGSLNIETILKVRRVIYYHNLVNRDINQTIYSFFLSQLMDSCRGDWVKQAHKDFEDFNISYTFSYLQNVSVFSFKKEVKEKAKIYFFNSLKAKQKKHSKMKTIVYDDFQLQPYLVREDISKEQKIVYFSWRTKMALFGENFRGGRSKVLCPLCNKHEDSQESSFECATIKDKQNINFDYDVMFCQSSTQLPEMLQTLSKILKSRSEYAIQK